MAGSVMRISDWSADVCSSHLPDMSGWRTVRGAAGRMTPTGFPRSNRFSCRPRRRDRKPPRRATPIERPDGEATAPRVQALFLPPFLSYRTGRIGGSWRAFFWPGCVSTADASCSMKDWQWRTRRTTRMTTTWPRRLDATRSEEHTSEIQSLMRISYAVFCLKKKTQSAHKTQKKHKYNNRKSKDVTQ